MLPVRRTDTGVVGLYRSGGREPARPPADPRSPDLVEALARLEVATRHRDVAAAATVLDELSHSEDGRWLLRQCSSAGLRSLADHLAGTGTD